MTVICTVHVPHSLAAVERAESENPEVLNAIVTAGAKYVTDHRRGAADGEVIELNEFADERAYEAFIAEAGPAIQRLNEILGGGPAVDTLYTYIPEEH